MVNQANFNNEFDIENYLNTLPTLEDTTIIEENSTTTRKSLSKLKIALWNCRGLCTPSKRHKKLTHILSKNYDINILTKTKLREEYLDYFRSFDECKYEVHANTNGNMRGVLIMSKKSTPLNMEVIERSVCGNLIMFTIKHDNQNILISAYMIQKKTIQLSMKTSEKKWNVAQFNINCY